MQIGVGRKLSSVRSVLIFLRFVLSDKSRNRSSDIFIKSVLTLTYRGRLLLRDLLDSSESTPPFAATFLRNTFRLLSSNSYHVS